MSERGEALKIQPDRIPFDLRAERRWVCWQYAEREGKWTKVPVTPLGVPAKCNDPSTWTTFQACVAAATRNGQIAGIGFVLGDGFVGVDLDHARDVESGRIAEWAARIIDRLRSYTEISPSGKGIHIICRGTLPPGRRRKGPIEMYAEKRYFTVTGRPNQRLRH
jgi:Uncharacterized conserved protein